MCWCWQRPQQRWGPSLGLWVRSPWRWWERSPATSPTRRRSSVSVFSVRPSWSVWGVGVARASEIIWITSDNRMCEFILDKTACVYSCGSFRRDEFHVLVQVRKRKEVETLSSIIESFSKPMVWWSFLILGVVFLFFDRELERRNEQKWESWRCGGNRTSRYVAFTSFTVTQRWKDCY